MTPIKITGTGSCLPDHVVTNKDLSLIVDTTDEWITTRTGIKERRKADENTATSDLAFQAASRALESAQIIPADVDVIIVATCTPDHLFPSVACLLQQKLGARKAAAFDISAACSGFIYALATAQGLLESGLHKTALVIGADTLSKFTNWKDRSSCVLFGDGAGAVVLEKTDSEFGHTLLSFDIGSDGSQTDILQIPGGGSRHPYTEKGYDNFLPYIYMNGKEVYRHAVHRMIETAQNALVKIGKKPVDLSLLIPHQANIRIIESIATRMKIPMDKVFLNIHKYGNMSAATTVVALDEVVKERNLKKGNLIELIAFGAGLTWGAVVIEW